MSMRGAAALAAVVLISAGAGADEAHIRIPAAFAARVQTGEQSGLIITLESDHRGPLVTVSQVVRPLGTVAAYPLAAPEMCGDPDALVVDEAFNLPRDVAVAAAAADSALSVLVGVVSHVSRRIVLDEGDQLPQDGVSVLRRGRGRCSGRANVTVGLLRAVGIPARVVHGVLFEGRQPRWHRWGEAWLGSLGWMPFDPGVGAGVVSVRYLPCRAVVPGLQPQGLALERVDEECFRMLPRRAGLRVPLEHGVNLRCRAPRGAGEIIAVLYGPDGMRWVRRGTSEVDFSGLLPARYWLSWRTAEHVVPRVPLDLRKAGNVALDLAVSRRSPT
jgi:hypothetical protein